MGYRLYSPSAVETTGNMTAYTMLRLHLGIPESEDVIEDRSFPMEFGLTHLHAISYTKGCYVGQEVVARSKTRGVLHKALHMIHASEPLPPADTPVMRGEAEIGILRTTQGRVGLAILRIEEAKTGELSAAVIPLTAALPDWFLLPTPSMITPSESR
jgi:folate-binding protein YgfZ